MNKTKKLTQGAMLLAIVGALMALDRQLSYMFQEMILLAIPVVIILYMTLYEIKDGGILSFGLLAIGFLFGSLSTYLYMPLSIIVGFGTGIAVKKDLTRQKISLIAIVLYIIGEVLITFIAMPLFGVDLSTSISELTVMMDQYGLSDSLSLLSKDVESLIKVIYIASVLLMGVLEGYLTCLISFILLKRLKIKNLGFSNLLDLYIPPVAAYILFGLSALLFFDLSGLLERYETLTYIVYCVSSMASMVLAYYGYVYFSIVTRLQFGKKGPFFVLLAIFMLFPASYFALLMVGFLYGAGPLRNRVNQLLLRQNTHEKK